MILVVVEKRVGKCFRRPLCLFVLAVLLLFALFLPALPVLVLLAE